MLQHLRDEVLANRLGEFADREFCEAGRKAESKTAAPANIFDLVDSTE